MSCKLGHTEIRKDGYCAECGRIAARRWKQNNKEKAAATQRAWRAANPERVEALRQKWEQANPEWTKDYMRRYKQKNQEKINSSNRAAYQANPEQYREAWRRKRAANPDRYKATDLARVRRRPLAEIQRTPAWLTAADYARVAAVYTEAARLTRETGIIHHVDHELPLRGRRVSGLHVPENLRPLPAVENLRKGNK